MLMRKTLLLLCCSLLPLAIAPASLAQAQRPSQSDVESANSRIDVAALVAHLQRINARMYGAYWCPYCTEQRLLFGDADVLVESEIYVECSEGGPHRATPWLCSLHRIRSYPTWIIGDDDYVGIQSLEQLAEVSGFYKVDEFEE